jgi:hypothetical protein
VDVVDRSILPPGVIFKNVNVYISCRPFKTEINLKPDLRGRLSLLLKESAIKEINN